MTRLLAWIIIINENMKTEKKQIEYRKMPYAEYRRLLRDRERLLKIKAYVALIKNILDKVEKK